VLQVASCAILVVESNKTIRSLHQVEGYEGQFTFLKKCPYNPKNSFHQKNNMGIKNAEFYADSKYVKMGLKFFC
jgi:hypothetical protein